MAHLTKLTRSEVGGIGVHVERQTDNHSNKDIDISKTHLNYSLLEGDLNVHQRLAQRLDEVYVFNRKDVNVACSWIVTLPNTLLSDLEEDKRLFFKETHNFLKKRYGGSKNVIMSEVHLDETTEHLHFVFVPTVYDKKNDREKVSAKEVIDRSELKVFHTDLDTHLRETIPQIYLNGILNDKTIGLKSVNDLKLYDKEIKQRKESLKSLNIAVEVKEERLKAITKTLSKEQYPSYIEQKQKLISRKEVIELPKEKWDKHYISYREYISMENQMDQVSKKIKMYETTDFYKTLKQVQQENEVLKNSLKQEERKNFLLEKENKQYKQSFKVLSQLQEILRDSIKDNFDKLMNFTERFNSLSSQLTNLAKGFLSATVLNKNIHETLSISKDCWNNSFELVSEEIFLPGNELELKEYLDQKHSKSYEMTR